MQCRLPRRGNEVIRAPSKSDGHAWAAGPWLPPLLETIGPFSTDRVSGVGARTRVLSERPACRALAIYTHVVVRRPQAGVAPVLAGGQPLVCDPGPADLLCAHRCEQCRCSTFDCYDNRSSCVDTLPALSRVVYRMERQDGGY